MSNTSVGGPMSLEERKRMVLPGIEVLQNGENKILFDDLAKALINNGLSSEHFRISYYSPKEQIYVFGGLYPPREVVYIPYEEIKERCLLKCCTMQAGAQLSRQPALLHENVGLPEGPGQKKANRRTKERKIGYIIDKVTEWRRYYTGTTNGEGQVVKYSLDEAAKLVNVAKKTLDDYLLQLRAGKKYGFDFNANREAKVGVLRSFVREHKQKEKQDKEPAAGSAQGTLFGRICLEEAPDEHSN